MADRFFSMRGVSILAVVFLLSLPAVTTRVNASDEVQFFSWLHSWTFDGDVDFDNEYRYFVDTGPGRHPGFIETFLESVNEAGRRLNFAPIGAPLLWLPFYGAGHVAAALTGAPADGFSFPYIAAVTYGSALYGFLALLLSIDVARRVAGGRHCVAAAVVWFGTPLLFYMYVAPVFAHAASAFAVSLLLWVWLRVRARWSIGGIVALGAAGALAGMVREQDLFFVAGPTIDFVRWAWTQRRAAAAGQLNTQLPAIALRAAIGVTSFVFAYAPQLASYYALNGHPSPTTTVTRKMTWTSPHFLQVLLSPEHGLFFWTPLAVVALAGVVILWLRPSVAHRTDSSPSLLPPRDRSWVAALMLVMVLLQVYVSGSVESWTVAGAFGQRRFVALTPILVVGLAALAPIPRWSATRRAVAAGITVLAVWWNIGLMAQFGLHLMDRQRLSLRDNARLTFLELPTQLPSVVMRYLTDRESFYQQPRQ
jgi:hypothetical protein